MCTANPCRYYDVSLIFKGYCAYVLCGLYSVSIWKYVDIHVHVNGMRLGFRKKNSQRIKLTKKLFLKFTGKALLKTDFKIY